MSGVGAVIPFEQEKKTIATNILDSCVKEGTLSQQLYIEIKASIFDSIEASSNANIGLNQIVLLTHAYLNKAGCKIAPRENQAPIKSSRNEFTNGSTQSRTLNADSNRRIFKKVSSEKAQSPIQKGKQRLLKLIAFLPPYLSHDDVKSYKHRITLFPVGPITESASPKTTGDLEYEIILLVRKRFLTKFDKLIKKTPEVFMDAENGGTNNTKKRNIGPQLRNNIEKAKTLSEFLSIRDLVVRHIDLYKENRPTQKSLLDRLNFWKN